MDVMDMYSMDEMVFLAGITKEDTPPQKKKHITKIKI
jgi:hypothetical protein